MTNGGYLKSPLRQVQLLGPLKEGLSRDDYEKIFRESFSADTYISSANAITENGELYNVDGNSNRVAAICYGPKSVIIIAGYNKIVSDIDEAIGRVKRTAAPANATRLSLQTYCREKGECMSLAQGETLACGCGSLAAFAATTCVGVSDVKGRIK